MNTVSHVQNSTWVLSFTTNNSHNAVRGTEIIAALLYVYLISNFEIDIHTRCVNAL